MQVFTVKDSETSPQISFSQARSQACLRGGKIVLEESRGIKSESLFHTLCYHNQMCLQEKIELSSISQRPRLGSTNISGDLSLATKMKQQQKVGKNSQGSQRAGICCTRVSFVTTCYSKPSGLLSRIS